MDSRDLIRIAESLAQGRTGRARGRPRQAELLRAISTAYYALFHNLASCGANHLIGSTPSRRSSGAWRQTYRALDHGRAKQQCTSNPAILQRFPQEIQDFAAQFIKMQGRRHLADYDPFETVTRSEVLQLIEETKTAIVRFDAGNRPDRAAFSAFVLFRSR